jgi:hypothetical protein
LNLPPAVVASASDDEVRARIAWPTPFCLDDEWPVTMYQFHRKPRQLWPVGHLKPGIGELRFLNWAYSFVMGKIANTSRDFIAVMKDAGEELKQTILRIAIFEDRLDEILDEMEALRLAVPLAPAPESAPEARPETFNLDELRLDAVRRAIVATSGHYGRAAALLGVSAKTMTKFAAEAYPDKQAKRGRRRRKPLPR